VTGRSGHIDRTRFCSYHETLIPVQLIFLTSSFNALLSSSSHDVTPLLKQTPPANLVDQKVVEKEHLGAKSSLIVKGDLYKLLTAEVVLL